MTEAEPVMTRGLKLAIAAFASLPAVTAVLPGEAPNWLLAGCAFVC